MKDRTSQIEEQIRYQKILAVGNQYSSKNRASFPGGDKSRAAFLSLCLRQKATPPLEALPWLLKGRRPQIDSTLWPLIWQEICHALIKAQLHLPFPTKNSWKIWQEPLIGILVNQIVLNYGLKYSILEQSFFDFIKVIWPQEKIIRHYKILGSMMHLDIYLPVKRIAIEVQGEQHWRAIEYYGGAEAFAKRQQSDAYKRLFCRQLAINLIEVSSATSKQNLYAKLMSL